MEVGDRQSNKGLCKVKKYIKMEGGEVVPRGQEIHGFSGGRRQGHSHWEVTFAGDLKRHGEGRNWGVEFQIEDSK